MAENKTAEVSKVLDKHIATVTGSALLLGFERAYLVSNAIMELDKLLTPEYMKPIMAMQNSRLGFLTDKTEGYPEKVVKQCLIDAVLSGFQPYGNQFNIIANNMYGTKEGYGYVLDKIPGLKYTIIPGLPRIPSENSAAVLMKIRWSVNDVHCEEEIDFAITCNKWTAKPDTVIGKATRKARAWLFSQVTGIEAGDAEIQETVYTEIKDAPIVYEDLLELYELKKEALLPAERQHARRILALKIDDSRNEDAKPDLSGFKKLSEQLKAL